MRPRRFELAAYWAEATRRFEESVYRDVATLRVSPVGLARLRRFGPARRRRRRPLRRAADARGWRKVTVPIESVEHAADEMHKLGTEGEVIAPKALRAALRGRAERLLALYGASPTSRLRREGAASAAAGRGGEDAAVAAGDPAGLPSRKNTEARLALAPVATTLQVAPPSRVAISVPRRRPRGRPAARRSAPR